MGTSAGSLWSADTPPPPRLIRGGPQLVQVHRGGGRGPSAGLQAQPLPGNTNGAVPGLRGTRGCWNVVSLPGLRGRAAAQPSPGPPAGQRSAAFASPQLGGEPASAWDGKGGIHPPAAEESLEYRFGATSWPSRGSP